MRSPAKLGSIVAVLLAAFTIGSARPAEATIIVLQGVNNQGTDNVLLNGATNVPIVTGTVNSGLFDVFFVSDSGLLNADASGQAVITPGSGNDPFTNISFDLGGEMFTRAVFNLNVAVNGFIHLTVEGMNIEGGMFQEQYAVVMNGQNFFTVTALHGQLISSIDLTGVGNMVFQDLRQVRIGTAPRIPDLPEPASMLLLGLGAVGLAANRLRRKRQ